jgi:hypothetical protein
METLEGYNPINQIQSKLTNEISKLFTLLKRETITGKELKNSILVLSTEVFNFLNNSKESTNMIETLSTIEYEVKEAIRSLILYKSKEIISCSNPIEKFTNFMERANKEIQVITIVFNKIVKEKYMILNKFNENDNETPFRSYYYKQFVENILFGNSITIFTELLTRINKLRTTLNTNNIYEKLLLKSDTVYNISDFLSEHEDYDNYNVITNILSILMDLDFLTENKFTCLKHFVSMYKRNLSKIYNVYGNSIFSIKNSNIKLKFNQLLQILIIESFLHNSLFTESDSYKELIKKEIVEPNLDFIKYIFHKNIIHFGDYFDEHLLEIKEKKLCISSMFENILEIPNFIDLYIKIYGLGYNIIQEIGEELGSQIEKYFKEANNEKFNLEFMFLSYIFLKNLEEEMIISFTPSNEEIEYRNLRNEYIADNYPFVSNIHEIFINIFSKFSHEQIIELMLSFSRKSISKKSSKNVESIYNFVNKVSNMYDREFNIEALRYIYFCANNKDELEESVKKYIVKKIVYTKLEEFDINKTLKIIDDISILPNICLKINSKLVDSFKIGNELSNEFNILYETSRPARCSSLKQDFMNLKHLPDGICNISPYEYEDGEFLSDKFKEYINVIKGEFTNYYKFKYDKRLLKWAENVSTIDIVFNLNNCEVCFCVNYKQADLLFLIQYEIDIALENLNTEIKTNSVLEINIEESSTFKEYMRLVKYLEESEFINFLIEKKLFIKTSFNVNTLTSIPVIEFNTEMKIKRDKKFDCYKLKFKDLQKSRIKNNTPIEESPPKKEVELAFFRSDYVQSLIMKKCKRNREDFIEEAELFDFTKEIIKTRFELEKPLFSTAVEKLVKNEYIEKGIIREVNGDMEPVIGYKYIP